MVLAKGGVSVVGKECISVEVELRAEVIHARMDEVKGKTKSLGSDED